MSNHSSGPWKIGTPPPNGEQTIGTQQGLMVAVATTGAGVPTEANARLIAAAPELLEALTEIVAAADGEGWNRLDATFAAARDAIAKARGDA